MKFGVLIDETGRERPLTQSSFSSFLVKRDHELRKRSFHQFYAEFRDHQYTLAAALAYSVKADVFHARARHYPSALQAALFPDDVPVAVYDGLIQSVRANLEPLFRYFDLRRRALGLAEVASTFNEELLTHHLLQTTSDPKMRAYIINRQIDELRGTLFRQTMFAEFEKIIHAIEESGDALTLDVFRSEYHKLLKNYFAEDFVLDPELDLDCFLIPHFYHAFYVYKYATGISAAVA